MSIYRFPNEATQYLEGILLLFEELTQGTETSKYLEEKKIINDFVSSGERKRKSLN